VTQPNDIWRFQPGDTCYVRGWGVDETVMILCQLLNYRWPHYIVLDTAGHEWRIRQLDLSSRRIPPP
jgi:hypothetical protein